MRKAATPETPRQAQTWDGNYRAYKAAGFCPTDAAQASWGHQIGFTLSNPVGDCCRGKTPPKDLERANRWANREAAEVES